jgi:glycosyltransferase involved in cell wall biosynthesis
MAPRPSGIGVYGRELIRALSDRSPDTYTAIYPLARWRKRRSLQGTARRARPYLSGAKLRRKFALVHALDSRLPARYDGPLAATLFDVLSALPLSAALGLSTDAFRRKKLRAYDEIARRARLIVAISRSTRDEFLARFDTAARVEVVPPGIDSPPKVEPAERDAVLRDAGIEPPFVLVVGALVPRKNIEGCLRAYDASGAWRNGVRLVVVGEPSFGWEGSAGEKALRTRAAQVVLTGYLPRKTVWAAYARAAAVLHLAHYEGFGLTVLEALAAGAPVVASDRGGIPEAAGGAAWLVDPNDDRAAGEALATAIAGGEEVAARRAKGLEHSQKHRWESTAAQIEELHREILGIGGTYPTACAPPGSPWEGGARRKFEDRR